MDPSAVSRTTPPRKYRTETNQRRAVICQPPMCQRLNENGHCLIYYEQQCTIDGYIMINIQSVVIRSIYDWSIYNQYTINHYTIDILTINCNDQCDCYTIDCYAIEQFYLGSPRLEYQWRKRGSHHLLNMTLDGRLIENLKVLADWSKWISTIVKIDDNMALLSYNHCTIKLNSIIVSML